MTPRERFDALNEHILLQYHYGSVVYGTMTEKSDVDIICVVDDVIDLSDAVNGMWEFHVGDNLDFQFVNLKRWKEMVANHHIWWLECYGLDRQYIIKGNPEDYMQYFKLDKWKLRQVISQIASNAWAKADKKMTVEKDYDLYRGQKSLFHSLRIMKFGIQIAKFGKIVDYHEANELWEEIYAMGECGWPAYKEKYKPLTNKLRSELTALCPKPEGYKMENQNKNKMEDKKVIEQIDIKSIIAKAQDDYKKIALENKKKVKNEEELTVAEVNDEANKKLYLETMRAVKQAFMEFVTKNHKKFKNVDEDGNPIGMDERINQITGEKQRALLEEMISERGKNVVSYAKAGRNDLVQKEDAEIKFIETLLPKTATPEDIEKYLAENYPNGYTEKQAGTIIGETKKAFERINGKVLSAIVMAKVKK